MNQNTNTYSGTASTFTAGGAAFYVRLRPPEEPGAAAMAVLGVPPRTPPDGIRKAFRARLKEVHPDVGGSDADARRVIEAMRQLQELGIA